MKKIIVTTTIYPPTEATEKFIQIKDWDNFIIIGDQKTPHDIYRDIEKNHSNIIYLSPEDQDKRYPKLSEAIGWNKIMRRNIGFIEAYKLDADIVASIDDDNIPYFFWGKEIHINKEIQLPCYETYEICFDPMSVTNYPHLWHRGFPVQLLSKRTSWKESETIIPDVQADFWNGDPDIDAFCRFAYNPSCRFNCDIFPFSVKGFSPFNSQNTFLSRKILKDYFVLPYVGRMDDIWAGYYIEALGYKVLYNYATVYQDRNAQDITKNMENEYFGYSNTEKLLHALKENPENINKFLPDEAKIAFDEYRKLF
jgi:hypothetical protein